MIPTDGGPLWAMVSGGKDSIATAHVLQQRDQLEGIVFIDTGIATPDTRPAVETFAAVLETKLEVYQAPQTYEELVLKYGFPGPSQHGMFMNYLKLRGVRQFKKAHPGEHLASGVRRHESRRRMANTKPWSQVEGVWIVAPIWDWLTPRVWSYLDAQELRQYLSPAHAKIHISGDCLCGAYASKGEIHLLRMFYPEIVERIADLERTAELAGQKYCRWGKTGGDSATGAKTQSSMEAFVCYSCEKQEG